MNLNTVIWIDKHALEEKLPCVVVRRPGHEPVKCWAVVIHGPSRVRRRQFYERDVPAKVFVEVDPSISVECQTS